MTQKNRYHRGFDDRSKKVYPYFLSYSSEEDAKEAIPALAKALGISRQAIGAYVGQALRHPGVYKLLTKMGYLDSQIPCWIKRPENPVIMFKQPQAAPAEIRPIIYSLAEIESRKSDLEILMDSPPLFEITFLSCTGYKTVRNPDLSNCTIETVHIRKE